MILAIAAALLHPLAASIAIDCKPQAMHFDITFKSAANRKLVVLSDECSWGWEAIRLELRWKSGKTHTVTRIGREWSRNFPMGDFLRPHAKLTRSINLEDRTWQGIPNQAGSTRGWQIRAIYAPKDLPTADIEFCLADSLTSPWVTIS